MGYYTHYQLSWDKPAPDERVVEARKRLGDMADEFVPYVPDQKIVDYIREHDAILHAVGEDGHDGSQATWYDHEADMRAMSAAFPGVLFTLSGSGEESNDIWKLFFRDGLMCGGEASIVYPEFDESALA